MKNLMISFVLILTATATFAKDKKAVTARTPSSAGCVAFVYDMGDCGEDDCNKSDQGTFEGKNGMLSTDLKKAGFKIRISSDAGKSTVYVEGKSGMQVARASYAGAVYLALPGQGQQAQELVVKCE